MMRLSEAASALATSLVGTDVAIHSVSTDTRTLTAGALFVALRGEHFNGHDYVPTAIERGAAAALVDAAHADAQWSIPVLPVADTLVVGRSAAISSARLGLAPSAIDSASARPSA